MNKKILAIVAAAVIVAGGAGAYLLLTDGDRAPGIDLRAHDVSLNIFGNADGDYRLDADDARLIRDYIDGAIPEGDMLKVRDSSGTVRYLADANCDGVVDEADITFLNSVIDRTGEKMNLLDGYGHFKSVPLRIDKVSCEFYSNCEMLMLMGAQDRIVAVDNALMLLSDYYLQGADIERIINFHSHREPDYEAVAEVEPDIWLTYGDTDAAKSSKTNAVVIGLNLTNVDLDNVYRSGVVTGTLLAGYIFNNTAAAERYVEWVIDLWTQLDEGSSAMAEKDKPVVFYTGYGQYITDPSGTKTLRCFVEGSTIYQAVKLAGGSNLVDRFGGTLVDASSVNLDIEWVVDQEYDYLFVHSIKFTGGGTATPEVPMHGYTTDDPAEYLEAHEAIAGMTVFEGIDVSDIYLTPGDFMNNASGGLLNAVMVAQAINPGIYPGLDIKKVHQEYIDIMGFDFDLDEHGVFYRT